ncbi:hypothetical protein BGZ72_001759 [Mortierella alpina]|nr:hypothetical protein BGZ72_001759 [Mortierella alpina]
MTTSKNSTSKKTVKATANEDSVKHEPVESLKHSSNCEVKVKKEVKKKVKKEDSLKANGRQLQGFEHILCKRSVKSRNVTTEQRSYLVPPFLESQANDKIVPPELKAFNKAVLPLTEALAIESEIPSRSLRKRCAIEPLLGLNDLLREVFGQSSELTSWNKSLKIVRGLERRNPLNRFVSDVVENYGALEVFNVETQSCGIRVGGNEISKHFRKVETSKAGKDALKASPDSKTVADESSQPSRKSKVPTAAKDLSGSSQVVGSETSNSSGNSITFAAGVGLSGSSQIYVAEGSKLYKAGPAKEIAGLEKVLRSMGDLVESQRKTSATSPHLTIFGSSSFKERTRFYSMDVTSKFTARQLDMEMTVPLNAAQFASMMPNCMRAALLFALAVSQENKRRQDKPKAENLRTLRRTRKPTSRGRMG